MNYKKATVIFVSVLIILIAVWDVFVIVNAGTEASISNTLIDWSYKYPVFTFVMGFAMGHLFWRMKGTAETKAIEEVRK